MPINRREDGSFIISRQSLPQRLGKVLGIVPSPEPGMLDGILPVVDVTPAKPGLQPLELAVINALGTFSAAAFPAGTYAGARAVGGLGVGLALDLITNIQPGMVFKIGGRAFCDSRDTEADASLVIASLQDQAGTFNFNQWAGIPIANNHFEWASPLLIARQVIKMAITAAGVAGRTHRVDYWIQIYETLTA